MELKDVLEAILFSAQKPLSPKELNTICVEAAENGGRRGESCGRALVGSSPGVSCPRPQRGSRKMFTLGVQKV